ncbi:MAG TPA: hypothetical protein VEF76_13645 [Patescibacteria group bacterium]|nr:hypothetical protein [Patescibacteria group bacterium]
MFASSSKDVDAKVVGNALVVSFTGEQPKVWRAEMAGVQTATLEIRDAGKSSSVVLAKAGQPDEVIVTYPDRESAQHAHKVISKAMLRGDVQAAASVSGGMVGKIIKWVVILLLVLFLVDLMRSTLMNLNNPPPRPGVTGATERGGNPFAKPGEPVPADQLFGGSK